MVAEITLKQEEGKAVKWVMSNAMQSHQSEMVLWVHGCGRGVSPKSKDPGCVGCKLETRPSLVLLGGGHQSTGSPPNVLDIGALPCT